MTTAIQIRTVAGTPATMNDVIAAARERVPAEQLPELARLMGHVPEAAALAGDLATLTRVPFSITAEPVGFVSAPDAGELLRLVELALNNDQVGWYRHTAMALEQAGRHRLAARMWMEAAACTKSVKISRQCDARAERCERAAVREAVARG